MKRVGALFVRAKLGDQGCEKAVVAILDN